jgi:hypothetical protein
MTTIPHKYDIGQKVLFTADERTYVNTHCELCHSVLFSSVETKDVENIGTIFGLKYIGKRILYFVDNARTNETNSVFEENIIKELDDDTYFYMIEDK